MIALADIVADTSSTHWQRTPVSEDLWNLVGKQLADGAWTLVAHWGEPAMVHAALREPATGMTAVLSLDAAGGLFPSLGRHALPARRPERTIRDLVGLEPEGAPDPRPWLDHGCWGLRHPLGDRLAGGEQEPYRFLPVEGEGLHQIPVGPVHAGIIEPGHFRFTASGETVVRLEERLGYVHKGIEGLLIGAPLHRAAKLAGRASGDSTVAYAIAFAQAVETACSASIPLRAVYLRAVMLELERIANHLGDIGAVCNDAAFSLMHTHCAVMRERVLRTADLAFGHRLMMDCVVPGGVAGDIGQKGKNQISKLVAQIGRQFPSLVAIYEDTASLQDRTVRTGMVRHDLVAQFGAGGYVGRASGRGFDARKAFPCPPYDMLEFQVPTLERGDVDARIRIRIREVEQSLSLLRQMLAQLPDGEIQTAVVPHAAEGASLIEGFRGDIFVWVRIDEDGSVARCHLRDPSCFQWPLLEAAIDGNIVADFPLCNKSFNCSYAGHDL
ncbi:MAG: hydrogenase expression protein HypE [Alphaproteobacteria bacterium]|nr:hydrogenase expression protein HypE [Alphaproteobacteria bacterium]MDE2112594.1 hydrogenase expression protein HypE [Alphaproteobacteria bacterium]MDE2494079.1 hydrogenase expression protein HypE [Alphaproteobacteria bacterium]